MLKAAKDADEKPDEPRSGTAFLRWLLNCECVDCEKLDSEGQPVTRLKQSRDPWPLAGRSVGSRTPIPSGTMKTPSSGSGNQLSSFCSRTRPRSVKPKQDSLVTVGFMLSS